LCEDRNKRENTCLEEINQTITISSSLCHTQPRKDRLFHLGDIQLSVARLRRKAEMNQTDENKPKERRAPNSALILGVKKYNH